ncbi:hypothetical protein SLEP1_g41035 [Rubroshorea leprosula]|uniref:Uncharacterized protein n=1 Tax=Rubroshorea leprosula TaxID=152421 RepID=A0AAV5L651_9ROSI|nr:hypothetical protein SLEP1_g41035 [Rubroshorea leprosula]
MLALKKRKTEGKPTHTQMAYPCRKIGHRVCILNF